MNLPQRSVGEALQRCGSDMVIADDGPHVAFVVGVMPDGRPTMWVAQSNGDYHDAEMFIGADDAPAQHPSTDAERWGRVPWSTHDLITFSRYAHHLIELMSHGNHLGKAHRLAIRAHEQIVVQELNNALATARTEPPADPGGTQ